MRVIWPRDMGPNPIYSVISKTKKSILAAKSYWITQRPRLTWLWVFCIIDAPKIDQQQGVRIRFPTSQFLTQTNKLRFALGSQLVRIRVSFGLAAGYFPTLGKLVGRTSKKLSKLTLRKHWTEGQPTSSQPLSVSSHETKSGQEDVGRTLGT